MSNETQTRKTFWGYRANGDEMFEGNFEARQEAIDAATERFGNCEFEVGWGCVREPGDFVPYTDDIVEAMGEQAYEEVGEPAEGWPEEQVTKEAEQELRELLLTWARKHLKVSFWSVDGTETVEAP